MSARRLRRWALAVILVAMACDGSSEPIEFGLTCGSIDSGAEGEHILQDVGLARQIEVDVGELPDTPEVLGGCDGPDEGWTVEVIEASLDVSPYNHGVAFDSQGVLHVGYSDGFTARHAALDEDGWSIEEVASGAVLAAAIAVGAGDELHMAWDEPRVGVSHAVRGEEGWRVEAVMAVAYASELCLAVDRHGASYLGVAVGRDGAPFAFVLANNEGGPWSADVVDWGANNLECSLSMGPAGALHGSYTSGDLGYFTLRHGELLQAGLPPGGRDSSIAALGNDEVVIVSMGWSGGLALTEGSLDGGFFPRLVDDLPEREHESRTPAVALDPEGRVVIAAARCGGVSLFMEHEAGWQVEQATDVASTGHVALAFDGDGRAHVVYATLADTLSGSLMHASRSAE